MRANPLILLLLTSALIASAVLADEPKPVPKPALQLEIKLASTELPVGAGATVAVSLKNTGDKAVSLVKPGDGSDCGWRTPIVGWSILPADSKAEHPQDPPLFRGGRCGNVNPIRADEVFSLAPGETQELRGWIGDLNFPAPGKYRLILIYKNDPTLLRKGLPLGEDASGIINKIKQSTPVVIQSNEVLVTVVKAE